jgi:hypothetical protein
MSVNWRLRGARCLVQELHATMEGKIPVEHLLGYQLAIYECRMHARGRWKRDQGPCPATTIPTKQWRSSLVLCQVQRASCSCLLGQGRPSSCPILPRTGVGDKATPLGICGGWLTPLVFLGVQTTRQAAVTLLYTPRGAGLRVHHLSKSHKWCVVMQFCVCALYRSSIAVLITCVRQCCLET